MKRLLLIACLACLLLIPAMSSLEAAPAKLEVQAKIEDVDTFWKCTYYPADKTPVRAAEIKLEWIIGDFGKPAATTLIAASKDSNTFTITSEKGEKVNLTLYVLDSKREILASYSLQVINKGTPEVITIVPPKTVQPEFIRS